MERLGAVAYQLKLPDKCKIHLVFHISQLKPVLGTGHEVMSLPDSLTETEELVLFPDELVDYRNDTKGFMEVLVSWKGLPHFEHTWMKLTELEETFPNFEFEGKLNFGEGGIIRSRHCYVKRKKITEKESLKQRSDVEL